LRSEVFGRAPAGKTGGISELGEQLSFGERLGPILHAGEGVVRVGTCSWTDPTLVKETGWYPRRSMSAAARLAFYAEHFPIVEADSTYYRPPSPELTSHWAERSPDRFVFNVKAYSLLTHHPTRPETLWSDVRSGIRADFEGKRNAYAEHLEPEALDLAWNHFAEGIEPLRRSGKLGAVLFQYPRWFTPRRSTRAELAALGTRLPGVRCCVEFRSPRWLEDDDRDATLATLEEADLALVVVDAPPEAHLPTVLAATRPDLAVVRLHGRADDTWDLQEGSAAERFRYLYRRDELEPWTEAIATLADEAADVHVLMNNCYRDYGVRNAQDVVDLLLETDRARLEG
jgi:uncharacterized protein YecE (DUF72 family)